VTKELNAKRVISWTIGTVVIVIIAISAAFVFILREREIDTWHRQVENLSLAMEVQTVQSMSSARIAMDSIAERIAAIGIRNADELRSRAKTEALHRIMRDKITGLTQVDVATLVAANGDVINFTRSFPAPAINLSDRDYFRAHRDTAALDLFISQPVRNRATDKWVFYLSRRLNDSNGKFMGLVLVGISVDQLTSLYERLGRNLGEGAVITLYRDDATVLARWPREDAVGNDFPRITPRHPPVETPGAPSAVIYTSASRLPGSGASTPRLSAVRMFDRLPMMISVTVTENFVLANWRLAIASITSVALGSTAALILVMFILLRMARQREQAANLLRELTDQVPGMLFQFRLFPDGRTSFSYVNQVGLSMHNLKSDDFPLDAERLFAQVHPDDKDGFRASIQESAHNLQHWRQDYRLLLPDKRVVWRNGSSRPQKLEDGTILWHGYIADITEAKHAEEALRRSEDRLSHAELIAKSGNWELHLDTGTMIPSKGAARIYGVDEAQYALPIAQAASLPEYRSLLDSALRDLIDLDKPYDVVFKIRTADTKEIKDIHSIAAFDKERRVVFGVIQDITDQKRAEEEQRLAATVFSHAREGIFITNAEGVILDVNQMFTRITGFSRAEAIGETPRLLSSGRHDKSFYMSLWFDLIDKGHWAGEIWNRRKDGTLFPEMLTISAVRDHRGKTLQYVALFSDITETKNHEQQLRYMAHYDGLTRLPNRTLLADRLQQAMSLAVRRRQIVAVCYLDLDGFKEVNDRYGHAVGDELLIALAAIMKQELRESDTLARIGGDEFIAVLLDLADEESSLITVERLIQTVARPIQLGGIVIQISASLGVTFFPQPDAVDADQLLRQADQAMYQAKSGGKNRYCVFRHKREHDQLARDPDSN